MLARSCVTVCVTRMSPLLRVSKGPSPPADWGALPARSNYTSLVDPLEERIRESQRRAGVLASERLAKLARAVDILRGLGAETVWLFGSLVKGSVHEGSDVDLMVKGLPSVEHTNAWLQLQELFAARVDLVPEEAVGSAFRDAVHRGGRDITCLRNADVAE